MKGIHLSYCQKYSDSIHFTEGYKEISIYLIIVINCNFLDLSLTC